MMLSKQATNMYKANNPQRFEIYFFSMNFKTRPLKRAILNIADAASKVINRTTSANPPHIQETAIKCTSAPQAPAYTLPTSRSFESCTDVRITPLLRGGFAAQRFRVKWPQATRKCCVVRPTH